MIDIILQHLPQYKKNGSGWLIFNAICCHHRHTTKDKRKRGGLHLTDGFFYHCFNCGFSLGWKPGQPMSVRHKQFLTWLGISDEIINKIFFSLLKDKDNYIASETQYTINEFENKQLPLNSIHINQYSEKYSHILEYLDTREIDYNEYTYYWSEEYKNRFIIPYYYNKQLVGYSLRIINEPNKFIPKYIKNVQPGYVFNIDNQHYNRKYVIVTEGELDAIAIDGVAVLSNNISLTQKNLIESLDKKIIVCPDNDSSGKGLIRDAIEYGWGVSFPNWEKDIKDVRDSACLNGKLRTLKDIIDTAEFNTVKIKILTKIKGTNV